MFAVRVLVAAAALLSEVLPPVLSQDLLVGRANNATATANRPLPKRAISSKMRLSVAVGLEGTGHAFVEEVDDLLHTSSPQLTRVNDKVVSYMTYRLPTLMGTSPEDFAASLQTARQRMRTLKQREASLDDTPGAVVIMHGKYSFPDDWGPRKVFKYMDLRLLAEVAEDAGVDFRVLYLRRKARDIILADTVHRQFHKWLHGPPQRGPPAKSEPGRAQVMEYMKVLFTDAAVVHSFLGELDPSFIVCHDFDHMGNATQAARIAQVLAPNAEAAEPLGRAFVDAARPRGPTAEGGDAAPRPPEKLPFPNQEVVAARLQRKLDAFENVYCGSSSRSSSSSSNSGTRR